MKTKFTTCLFAVLATASAHAANQGLYYMPNDTEESVPLAFSVGINAVYDDNTTPGGVNDGDESISLNPYVGINFVSITPQTTWDVYARLGAIYYLDEPEAQNTDDIYGQARAGVDLTHRFNERLRFASRNFIAYELEPDYSYGFASTRQNSEYFYWQTDNSIGYRWTERFATYTGFQLTGLNYDELPNQDRFTYTFYNQFRYQVSPQTVVTASYRYSETEGDGAASDSENQYFLIGVEHRFSPSTILIANVGAQLRDVDGFDDDTTSPYLELTLRTAVNTQFSISLFARYGIEDYDTVFGFPGSFFEYSEKTTLRVGVSGSYQISPALSLFGGVDVINSSFEDGQTTDGFRTSVEDADETLVSAYIGASLKFTDYLYGNVSYTYTSATSDFDERDYDRNRISVGLRAEF